jgi:hypothetical protein
MDRTDTFSCVLGWVCVFFSAAGKLCSRSINNPHVDTEQWEAIKSPYRGSGTFAVLTATNCGVFRVCGMAAFWQPNTALKVKKLFTKW